MATAGTHDGGGGSGRGALRWRRRWPTSGMPPVLGGRAEYDSMVEMLVATDQDHVRHVVVARAVENVGRDAHIRVEDLRGVLELGIALTAIIPGTGALW